MRFELASLAQDLGAELRGDSEARGAGAAAVDGLAIDSRSVSGGELFAALAGERDGHDFVAAARGAGAGAALVERMVDDGPSLVVRDVSGALAELARTARRRLAGPVVGVTGSVGKTTTKDMLANVLGSSLRTAASQRSFNNELGVPLTLANAADDTEATVVEMGARGSGHIALLCSMASPTVGVVTAVHAVHTEVMGSEDDIARAKGELVEALPSDGLAVLNGADARVAAMASLTDAEVITFGAPDSDLRADEVSLDEELHAHFTLRSRWGDVPVRLGARGEHNVGNALAAAAVGLWAGVDLGLVAESLGASLASPWRMELERSPGGLAVLNDAYNAGPASMAAALRALGALDAERRVAVLGVMAELGHRSASEHEAIAALAQDAGIELVAVGTDAYGVDPVDVGTDDVASAVVEHLGARGLLHPGAAVLVKGSRVARLEAVAAALLGDEALRS